MDIGPTVLDLFGVAVPDYMDGKPLAVGDGSRSSRRASAKTALAEVS